MNESKTITPIVIAISGTSGAGKTTLTRRLSALLPGAVAVYFDDFAASHRIYPDLGRWIASGGDPADWCNEALAQHIRNLKQGVETVDKTAQKPAQFIVLEEPFGRTRPDLRNLIDFVVVVDLPADLALARVLLRYFNMRVCQDNPARLMEILEDHLKRYESAHRRIYEAVIPRSRGDCDLVLDGTLPLELLEQRIMDALHARYVHLLTWDK